MVRRGEACASCKKKLDLQIEINVRQRNIGKVTNNLNDTQSKKTGPLNIPTPGPSKSAISAAALHTYQTTWILGLR